MYIYIYVVTPPSQPTVHPINGTVILFNDLPYNHTLTCVTVGAASYMWEKHPYGGIPPSITATGKNFKVLTLIKLQPHYEGSYRCLAINGSGSTYSNFTTVTIEGLLIIQRNMHVCLSNLHAIYVHT